LEKCTLFGGADTVIAFRFVDICLIVAPRSLVVAPRSRNLAPRSIKVTTNTNEVSLLATGLWFHFFPQKNTVSNVVLYRLSLEMHLHQLHPILCGSL